MSDHDRGPSIALVADMLAEKALDFCRDFLPHGVKNGPRWSCGDVYGSRGQSLSVLINGPKAGHWQDFNGGDKGDLIDLLCRNKNCDKKEAYKLALSWLGISRETWRASESRHCEARRDARQERRERDSEKEARQKLNWARALWQKGKPGAGSVVEAYLRNRAITLDVPAALALAPLLEHKPTGRMLPCMIAAVVGPDNTSETGWGVIAVHRTYLEVEGLTHGAGAPHYLFEHHVLAFATQAIAEPWRVKKLDHAAAKMILGSPAGGSIPLTPKPLKSTLALSEGIENGLSWAQKNPGASVRAAYSAGNMGNVAIGERVRRLVFIKDGTSGVARDAQGNARLDAEGREIRPADEALRKAAQTQANLAADAGRVLDVEIWHAAEGKDANDMLREGTL